MLLSKLEKERPPMFYFRDIKDKIIYNSSNVIVDYKANNVNFKFKGQIKLLLNEIRFLTCDVKIHDIDDKDSILILYIGSAPGSHIPTLIELYKHHNITWILYDPYPHCKDLVELLKENKEKGKKFSIKIFQQLFNIEEISEIKNIKTSFKHFIFISDIRSVDKGKREPNTDNLIQDYYIQNKVLKELNPDYSLLKYRYPFPDDFIKEKHSYEEPISDKLYLQACVGKTSAETRISLGKVVGFKKINDVKILEEAEQKFAWYNCIFRYANRNDFKIAAYIINEYNKLEKKTRKLATEQYNEYSIVKFLQDLDERFDKL